MNRDEAIEEAVRLRSEGTLAVAGPFLNSEGKVEWDIFYLPSHRKTEDKES